MDRGFIPPESGDSGLKPEREQFIGEFGERDHAPVEVDSTDPRIAVDPETGEVRPM